MGGLIGGGVLTGALASIAGGAVVGVIVAVLAMVVED